MTILEIDGLTKKFGDVIAVDDMSLKVKEGEIFGFLGSNGAGKSTSINMVTGLLKKSKGSIHMFEAEKRTHGQAMKKHIGLVPQDLAIYEDLTAYENVHFFAGLYGLRGQDLHDRTMEALKFVGLNEKYKSYPKAFSGGMKRRLNIACAIAHQPKLIIMDEPTVGIDPQSRHYILSSVKKLNEMGCTIIYTSHYMEEVEEICTRIAIIDHGKIIAEGTKQQLKSLITDAKHLMIEAKPIEKIDQEEILAIQGVNSVVVKENSMQIATELDGDYLNQIIAMIMKQGAEIKSLTEKEPNLETVFLTLTGRSLRDS